MKEEKYDILIKYYRKKDINDRMELRKELHSLKS